jgi:uncharacterized protein (DUF2461 family)
MYVELFVRNCGILKFSISLQEWGLRCGKYVFLQKMDESDWFIRFHTLHSADRTRPIKLLLKYLEYKLPALRKLTPGSPRKLSAPREDIRFSKDRSKEERTLCKELKEELKT